jgi:hypothetical protein
LSAYVTQQFEALQHTDSITVDPHKSGYIPYPAGALCYRNRAMRDMVTFTCPVIAHGDAETTMGIYGIEGSKPGAAVAAVYLSHKVIRPTKSGYGRIHGQALFSCKRLYARLVSMAFRYVVVVPVPRLPAERNGEDATAQLHFIRERIDRRSNEEILADPEALSLLQELGPDQNILAYAFNVRDLDGRLNTDLARANRLNRRLYDVLSIKPGRHLRLSVDAQQYGFSQPGLRQRVYPRLQATFGGGRFSGRYHHRVAIHGDGSVVDGKRSGIILGNCRRRTTIGAVQSAGRGRSVAGFRNHGH